MKALLIKCLPWTATKPARYKVSVLGKQSLILNADSDLFDSEKPIIEQVADMSVMHFQFHNIKYVVGQLPNGDHCVTLESRNN